MQVELTEAERTKIIYLLTGEIDYLIARINEGNCSPSHKAIFEASLKVAVTAANKLSTERTQEDN